MYKISGITTENSRILVINELSWTVETTQSGVLGAFEIDTTSGTKIIIARNTNGSIDAYGRISPFYLGGRGVFMGGYEHSNIEYISIDTPGNAQYFGDLTLSRRNSSGVSNGNNERGVCVGGNISGTTKTNVMDYITISTTGNAIDFGDYYAALETHGSSDNGINDRGVVWTGRPSGIYTHSNPVNTIQYITISTLSDSSNFGDLNRKVFGGAGSSNDTNNRGVFAGGGIFIDGTGQVTYNNIDYINISILSNSSNFGDLLKYIRWHSCTSNGTNDRAVFAGGNDSPNVIPTGGGPITNIIEYITISTTSNASDFGDLLAVENSIIAVSNKTGNRAVFGCNTNNRYEQLTISSLGNATYFGEIYSTDVKGSATSNS